MEYKIEESKKKINNNGRRFNVNILNVKIEQETSDQGCDCREGLVDYVKNFESINTDQPVDIESKYLSEISKERNEKQECNGFKTNSVAVNFTTVNRPTLWKDYCDLCQAIFTTPANLAYHYQQHTRKMKVWQIQESQECNNKARALYAKLQVGSGSDAVFQCDRCPLNFKFPNELALHYVEHFYVKSANMSENDECIIKPREMYKHLKVGTGNNVIYKCDRCKLEYKNVSKLAGHYHRHVGLIIKHFRCNQCELTFYSRTSLGKHYRKHTSGEEFLHQCPECGKPFKTDDSLATHLKTLHKVDGTPLGLLGCKECGKTFTNFRGLNHHKRIHSRPCPYVCKPCNKSYVSLHGWVNHNKTHGSKKQLQCHYCGKTYCSPGSLKNHINRHLGDRSFRCAQCSLKFYTSDRLAVHIRQHTGERPYKCQFCKKYFVQRKHLILHTRIHTGVKPYCCKICPDKAFIQNMQLKLHMKTHHGTQLN